MESGKPILIDHQQQFCGLSGVGPGKKIFQILGIHPCRSEGVYIVRNAFFFQPNGLPEFCPVTQEIRKLPLSEISRPMSG